MCCAAGCSFQDLCFASIVRSFIFVYFRVFLQLQGIFRGQKCREDLVSSAGHNVNGTLCVCVPKPRGRLSLPWLGLEGGGTQSLGVDNHITLGHNQICKRESS